MAKGWAVIVAGMLAVLATMPLSAAAAAQEGPMVSVDFKAQTMQEIADYLAVKAGVNIVVEKGVVGVVSLRVNDYPWLGVLDLAAKQVGCTVEKGEDSMYYVRTPHFTFTTKAEGVSLKQVLSLLAQQSNQNIVVAPDVDAIVHFNLQDVPWQVALDTIVRTAGPFQVVRDDAGVYRVVRSDALAEERATRVFKLKYIQPPSEYKPKIDSQFAEKTSGTSTSGGGGGGAAKALKENFTLYKAIDDIIIGKGTVQYDFDSNAFIVNTTKPLLDEVADVIRLVDVPVDQVFVDVKFVTTAHTDLLNAGVRFPKGFMISASGGSMVHRLPFNLGKGGWEDDLSVTGDGPTPDQVDAALGGESPYTFGVLDFSNITPVLEFLKTDSESEIVQAPTLTVVDNKSATVFIGEEIHFAEEFSTTNQGGQLSRGIREASMNSPVSVGTQLMIMPHIVPDTNQVVLSVIPTSQQLTGTSSPAVSGFERFSVGESFIDLPRLSSRTVVTTLMLQDGQTAVIGGLINQSNSENITKLPLFGDLPIVGWLFKNKQRNFTINNLYIFITVRILHNQEDVNNLFTEYEVPAATVKPFKPSLLYPDMAPKPEGDKDACSTDGMMEGEAAPAGDMAAEPAPKSAVASAPGAPASPVAEGGKPLTPGPDVVGKGWEETKSGVETFEMTK